MSPFVGSLVVAFALCCIAILCLFHSFISACIWFVAASNHPHAISLYVFMFQHLVEETKKVNNLRLFVLAAMVRLDAFTNVKNPIHGSAAHLRG